MALDAGSIQYSVEIETANTLKAQSQIDSGFDKLQDSMEKTDQSAKSLSGGMSKLATAITAVVSAQALRSMADLVQGYQEMAERIKMASASTAEYEMIQARLLATANATYRPLAEAQEIYLRTESSLKSMGYTTEQALDVTESLSLAFVKSSTSADRANIAMGAFSRSLAKGRVDSDAWEMMLIAIPDLADQMAASLGKTSQEVRMLGVSGELTTKQLSDGLRSALEENSKAAAGMSANMRDASVRTTTALTAVLVAIEDQSGALQTLTDGIVQAADLVLEFAGDSTKMASALDVAGTAAATLATVIAAKLVGSMSMAGYEMAKSAAQTVSQAAAARAAAVANLELARTEAANAAQALIKAKAYAQATVGLSTHAAAVTALTAAEARAAAATAGLSAAATTMTRTAGIATVAVNGLRTAMAFLGGPVGIAILAATAIWQFASASKDAKPPVDLLAESIDDLGDATLRLREIQLQDAIEKLKGLGSTSSNSGAQVEYLKKQLEQFPNSAKADEWRRQLAEQEAAAEGAGKELTEYEERLKQVQDRLNNKKGKSDGGSESGSSAPAGASAPVFSSAGESASKSTDAIKDRIAALEHEADTFGMTRSELALYELQLAGATDKQIQAAASALAQVEAYEMLEQATKDAQAAEESRRAKYGSDAQSATDYVRGNVDPLSGGAFDDQTARYDAEALAEQERYAAALKRLKQAELDKQELLTSYQAEEERLKAEHDARMEQIDQAKNSVMLQSGQDLFAGLAGAMSSFAGEQSGIYKAMFAASKAFAIADAVIKIQQGIANAAAMPFPANLGAMATVASATGSIVSSISSVTMSGKALGGPVQPNQMYRVNETGAPEIFNAANGRQYMVPNSRGEVVSNKDAASGAGTEVIVNIHNNASGATATQTTRQQERQTIIDVVVSDMMQGGKIAQTTNRITGTQRGAR